MEKTLADAIATPLIARLPAGSPERVKAVDAYFALHALMEVPEQYQAVQRLELMGKTGAAPPTGKTTVVHGPPAGAPPVAPTRA